MNPLLMLLGCGPSGCSAPEEEKEKPSLGYDPELAKRAKFQAEFNALFPEMKEKIDALKSIPGSPFAKVDDRDIAIALYGSLIQENIPGITTSKQVNAKEGSTAVGALQLEPSTVVNAPKALTYKQDSLAALKALPDLSPGSVKLLQKADELSRMKKDSDRLAATRKLDREKYSEELGVMNDADVQSLIKVIDMLAKKDNISDMYESTESGTYDRPFWDSVQAFQHSGKPLYEQGDKPTDETRRIKLKQGQEEMTAAKQYVLQYLAERSPK
jgi:hypothetical protein